MSVEFITTNHNMLFVNMNTGAIASPGHLDGNVNYQVFLELKNTDALTWAKNVVVMVTHTPFGIGLPDTTEGVTQPAIFTIPPNTPTGSGRAIVSFIYDPPPAGHCCLYARVVSIDGMPVTATFQNKMLIQQNTTVYTYVVGQPAKPFFLVFGHKTQTKVMHLKVVEYPANGSWGFSLDLSSAGGSSNAGHEGDITLPPDSYRVIYITTTPAGTTNHVFHVTGTENNVNVGEVDITVRPAPAGTAGPCDPFVYGGVHSPDIILYYPGTSTPIPLPLTPYTDDTLLPNTQYGFAAKIHNFSDYEAVNVVVRFWQTGFGTYGTLLDIATANVPAHGSVIVESHVPFKSGAAETHRCAIVSVFHPNAGVCHHDAPVWGNLPQTITGEPSCAAWRNTWSQTQFLKMPIDLNFELIWPELPHIGDPGDPVELSVIVQHIPAGWDTHPETVALKKELRLAGRISGSPLYLHPAMRSKLKPLDIGLKLVAADKKSSVPFEEVKPKAMKLYRDLSVKPVNAFQVRPPKNAAEIKATPIRITGKLPEDVKAGDQVIVHVMTRTGRKELAGAYDTDNIRVLNIRNKEK